MWRCSGAACERKTNSNKMLTPFVKRAQKSPHEPALIRQQLSGQVANSSISENVLVVIFKKAFSKIAPVIGWIRAIENIILIDMLYL